MKLPKFHLTSFNGDSLKWTALIETFIVAVDSQDSLTLSRRRPLSYRNQSIDLLRNRLTAIEKITYLKGQLEEPAAYCIQGFSLTSKNYEEAKQLLEERLGNLQAVISAHMNVLLKLPKLNNDSVVSRLSFIIQLKAIFFHF